MLGILLTSLIFDLDCVIIMNNCWHYCHWLQVTLVFPWSHRKENSGSHTHRSLTRTRFVWKVKVQMQNKLQTLWKFRGSVLTKQPSAPSTQALSSFMGDRRLDILTVNAKLWKIGKLSLGSVGSGGTTL
jgi:hypothetical protein